MVTVIWIVGTIYVLGVCVFGLAFINYAYQSRGRIDVNSQFEMAWRALLWPYAIFWRRK